MNLYTFCFPFVWFGSLDSAPCYAEDHTITCEKEDLRRTAVADERQRDTRWRKDRKFNTDIPQCFECDKECISRCNDPAENVLGAKCDLKSQI